MRRRDFLAATAALPLIACQRKTAPPLPPGELGGGRYLLAHRLRQADFPEAVETRRVPVLIVGAGIAGLSAAWTLERAGMKEFALYELEDSAGGNARFGTNAVTAYPLGAHYLPLPPPEARAVRALLADLGAITQDAFGARPTYDQRLLCAAPKERVFHNGLWQEGLIPRLGVAPGERAQVMRFFERMAEFRGLRDAQGRRAFALPLALSSPQAAWRALDRLTLRQWLLDNGFNAPLLHRYADYCCRDDYGTGYASVSAYAGLHYFACRHGEAANAAPDTVLTAPEGNGWIVRRLAPRYADRTVTAALALRVEQDRRSVRTDFFLAPEQRVVRVQAEHLIWAAPPFVLPKVAVGLPPELAQACAAETAPWLVANLTLRAPPQDGAGAPLAWDNVLWDSPALGYVVATHQRFSVAPGPTVLTYYHALGAQEPGQARHRLLTSSREHWAEWILADLGRAHPDIRALTVRLDVHRHGHAMMRPLPGLVWSERRQHLERGWGRVQLAHADVSGLSLFEEANDQGVRAAENVLRSLGIGQATPLRPDVSGI